MGRPKKEAVAEDVAPAQEVAKVRVETKKSVSVCDYTGQVIRTYNQEEHGEDFAEKAKSFASKSPDRSIK
jgi:hypothetical protein